MPRSLGRAVCVGGETELWTSEFMIAKEGHEELTSLRELCESRSELLRNIIRFFLICLFCLFPSLPQLLFVSMHCALFVPPFRFFPLCLLVSLHLFCSADISEHLVTKLPGWPGIAFLPSLSLLIMISVFHCFHCPFSRNLAFETVFRVHQHRGHLWEILALCFSMIVSTSFPSVFLPASLRHFVPDSL